MSVEGVRNWIEGGSSLCAPGAPLTSGQILGNLFAFAIVYSALTAFLTFTKKMASYNTEKKVYAIALILIHALSAYCLYSHSNRCRASEGFMKALAITVVCIFLVNHIFKEKPNKRNSATSEEA